MKFISKSTNLLVVLAPGMSAQPLTGTPAKPTISVRFKDGITDISQPDLVEMMLNHPGFNSDFISAEENAKDPYLSSRTSSEPQHIVTEMKFGTPVARTVVGGDKPKLPKEMEELVKSMAVELAKSMLPSMVESTLKSLVAERTSDKKAGKKAGKRGRPARVKKTVESEPVESVAEEVVTQE